MIAEALVTSAIEQRLRSEGRATVLVFGRSMLPTMWPGCRVTVRRCDPSELRVGDVVAVRRGEVLVIHRLVRRSTGAWVTRGDAHDFEDPPLRDDEILGRLEGVVLGRSQLRLPRPVAHGVNRGLQALTPIFRRAREPVRLALHRGRRALFESASLRSVRSRVQPWRVEPLTAAHRAALRRALLRRGLRPDESQLEAWKACIDEQPLPHAVVAVTPKGEIIGYGRVHRLGSELCGLFDLWVAPSHRGLGVGSAIVDARLGWVRERAAELELRTIVADVRPGGGAELILSRRGFSPDRIHSSGSPSHQRLVRGVVARG